MKMMRSSTGILILITVGSGFVAGCDGQPVDDTEAQQSALLLAKAQGDAESSCIFNGVSMLCCKRPNGTIQAMVGYHADSGYIKCAQLIEPIVGAAFVDGPNGPNGFATQRAGMHACPLGSVMLGIDPINNNFICQQLEHSVTEAVDGPSNAAQVFVPAGVGWMHVCPPANASSSGFYTGKAMSGVRIDMNQFLCAN